MILKISTFVLISIFLGSCSGTPKNLEESMVPLSDFTIKNDALQDGEFVEILGASGNLTSEHKHDFYNLIVVRSEKTGDTINVLSTSFFLLDESTNSRTQFISNAATIGKIMESNKELKNKEDLNPSDLKSKKFNRVLMDREFIHGEIKNRPTVIGILATTSGNEDLEDLEILLR